MVINTNLIGTGGTPLAKLAGRAASNSKAASPSDNPFSASTLKSQADQLLAGIGSDIEDTDAAQASAQLNRVSILNQPAMALLAQANLSPETVLSLLQE